MTDSRDPAWLRTQFARVLGCYHPDCVDETHGGFVAQFHPETGAVYDREAKHLVATARFTVNYQRALRHLAGADRSPSTEGPDCPAPAFDADELREGVERGVAFLRDAFHDSTHDGYHWLLEGRTPVDTRRVCYGHAFVVLAFASGVEADVDGGRPGLENALAVLDERFLEESAGLYRSEFAADWTAGSDYRGQNANMHACEALLAVHGATGDQAALQRAETVARRLCVELASRTDGKLWEHYDADWTHDFAYNRDEPRHQFRPWGYQPGHHAEWAKLLALLDRRVDPAPDWALPRARDLFAFAVEAGWDPDHGGFYYTLDRDGDPIVREKYGWPVAEAIGAAAALHERTGSAAYLEWYDRLWSYATEHLVAPQGCWYERLSESGSPIVEAAGPAVEPGYHPIGACTEALRSFASRAPGSPP